MYEVIFDDEVMGEMTAEFEDFDAAAEYWNDYADTETCTAGELVDRNNGEVIWRFGD